MKICETYAHLNGLEFLLVHRPELWKEIQEVVASVDAGKCRTKVSKEKGMEGKILYSPIDMNATFKKLLKKRDWEESRVKYWVTKSEKLIRKTLSMPPEEQKKEIEAADEIARGNEAAQRVRATADRTVVETVSEAQKQTDVIRGDADAQRNAIFADAFGRDPEIFAFYRSLTAYETSLKGENSTLVISPDSEFFDYLKSDNIR